MHTWLDERGLPHEVAQIATRILIERIIFAIEHDLETPLYFNIDEVPPEDQYEFTALMLGAPGLRDVLPFEVDLSVRPYTIRRADGDAPG